jgi:hypothetical protein
MIAVLAFLRSPIGRYLLGAIAVVLPLASIYLKGAHDGYAKAKPLITEATQRLQICNGGLQDAVGAIKRQNAALTAIQQVSDRKLADAANALSLASKGRAGAEAKAAKLLARPPAGIDACARMESADAAVMETLK